MAMSDDLVWSDEYLDVDPDYEDAGDSSAGGGKKKKGKVDDAVFLSDPTGTTVFVGARDAEILKRIYLTPTPAPGFGQSRPPLALVEDLEPIPPPPAPPDVLTIVTEVLQAQEAAAALAPDPAVTVAGPGTNAAITRFGIDGIRYDKRLQGNKEAIAQSIFRMVLQNEQQTGARFLRVAPNGLPYIVFGRTNTVVPIDSRNRRFAAHLWYHYNLNASDGRGYGGAIVNQMQAFCTCFGKERSVRRFVAWSEDRKTLYVNRYDGSLWKIKGSLGEDEGLEIIPNGQEMLFADDDDGVAPKEEDVVVGPNGVLLPFLTDLCWAKTTGGGMAGHQQRLLFSIWIFALAFPDLFPAKPILLVDGPQGSGKSTALQLVQMALHGRRSALIIGKGDEREFSVQIARTPIGFMDNIDTYIPWLQDAICAYTTSGEWQKRKLYTDDEIVKIKPTAFLAVSSRSPVTFRRPDVADRCLLLKLDRRENDFGRSSDLEQEVGHKRGQLFGEWLWYLNRIVAVLREGKIAASAAVRNRKHRMADFTVMAHVIGHVLGRTADEIDSMLEACQREREAFVAEGDVIKDVLALWLNTTSNVGRLISQSDLYKELSEVATANGRHFVKQPITMHRKLKEASITTSFMVETEVKGSVFYYKIEPVE